MHVQFKVHGSGKKNLHGDGIALWYTRDRLQAGRTTVTVLMVPVGRAAFKVLASVVPVVHDVSEVLALVLTLTPSAKCLRALRCASSVRLLWSHPISASILGPVFGNQDHFVGLAMFLDTFRNDLHGMDVSV